MRTELRERAHELIRAELVDAAFELIVEHGYEALTAEDLARGLGISRATFFRYLGSKDEVIVSAVLGDLDQFAEAMRASRLDPAGSRWHRLRAAFEPAVVQSEESAQRLRKQLRLIQSLPLVSARVRRARVPQIESLADALVEDGADEFASQVLATAAVAVLDQCWVRWGRDEQASLRTILDRAFAELAAGSEPLGAGRADASSAP
ncbi:TetR/AcrR family transcriptional regulator [Propionicicella superfundia]|uniref:TetR/AcrR family transcriptional regulator n=1 Tax=Propionicicella superfundia TaxID=348582 RepID=UPI00041D569C|nr:TetR/AcrR family transcriptional regulator [Propionicicella superfundia]